LKLSMKYWGSGLGLVGIVVALLGSTMVFAGNPNQGVLPINGQVGGLTYGQWSARWWQYAFSLTTFDNCPAEPSGQMWFLAGTTGGSASRSCTVPAGKNIMFPIFNAEQSVVEANVAMQQTKGQTTCTVGTTPIPDINGKPIKGTGYSPLHRCAQAIAQHALLTQQGASLEATVDKQELTNLTHYRAATPPPLFPFTAVAGNPFGVCELVNNCLSGSLTSMAAADGFWIILTPLKAGKHTIHFAATVPFPEIPFKFTTDVTYNLIVK
jgi:hypothetical protein